MGRLNMFVGEEEIFDGVVGPGPTFAEAQDFVFIRYTTRIVFPVHGPF